MDPLAYVYSAANVLRRNVKDLAANPGAYLERQADAMKNTYAGQVPVANEQEGLGMRQLSEEERMKAMTEASLDTIGGPMGGFVGMSRFTDSLKPIDKFLAAHGTPSVFPAAPENPLGAFRWDKINTGEGAQVFGMGHYLAGDEGISRVHYRDRLMDQRNSSIVSPAVEYDRKVAKLKADALRSVVADEIDPNALGFKAPVATQRSILNKLASGRDYSKSIAKMFDDKVKMDELDFFHGNMKKRGYGPEDMSETDKMYAFIRDTPATELYSAKHFPQLKEWANQESRAVKVANKMWHIDSDAYGEAHKADIARLLKKYGVDGDKGTGMWGHPQLVEEYKALQASGVWEAAGKAAKEEYLKSLPPKAAHDFAVADRRNLGKRMALLAKKAMASKAVWDAKQSGKFDLSNIQIPDIGPRPDPSLGPQKQPGALYTVEVGASPNDLLPLDMPMAELKEDMPHVYEALKQVYPKADEFKTPMGIVSFLNNKRSQAEEFSKGLNERGVPGNMYLARGNRSLDTNRDFDPTAFNYVMHNDDVAKIIARELREPKKAK